MKKTIIFAFFVLSFFSLAKAEEIKISNYQKSLIVIKISEDETQLVVLGEDGRIFISEMPGNTWLEVTKFGFIKDITDVEITNDKKIFAVGDGGLAFKTVNGGKSWSEINGLPNVNFTKVEYTNQQLFILGEDGVILRSGDFGETFENFSVSSTGNFRDVVFKKFTDFGFIASDEEPGLWYSADSDSTWRSHFLPQQATITASSIDDSNLYVIGMGEMGYENPWPLMLRINVNNFEEWMVTPFPESFIPSDVFVKDGKGVVVMNKSIGEVWKTTSYGMSWTFQQMNKKMHSVTMSGTEVLIASDSGMIIRYDILVGIPGLYSDVPSGYILNQNYPNPFNPKTTINFSIPKAGNVKLSVFNTAGKEVQVLLNQSMNVGSYTFNFDATNLTSGVYFYTLQTERYIETRKMLLVK